MVNKEMIEKVVKFIESCWDENNLGDGLTFDERIEIKMKELPDEEQEIIRDALSWC